jgi:hypothetical protein
MRRTNPYIWVDKVFDIVAQGSLKRSKIRTPRLYSSIRTQGISMNSTRLQMEFFTPRQVK